MTHESDESDAQLLADGDIAKLLAKYDTTIRGRCHARIRNRYDAEDVAQNVRLRLLSEFHRGKVYPVPYRVVLNQVVTWTIGDFFEGRRIDEPLPENWMPASREASTDDALTIVDLTQQLDGLPGKDREVCRLRLVEGWEIGDIAKHLSMQRNAVDQALWRGRQVLREAYGGG